MFRNHSPYRRIPKPLRGLFFLGMAALFLFVLGNIIMFLWNNILAEATEVKTLNLWQSIGLFILTRILFGGFRFNGRQAGKQYKRRKAWKEKWVNMNEEERAEFKQKWKERCAKKDN